MTSDEPKQADEPSERDLDRLYRWAVRQRETVEEWRREAAERWPLGWGWRGHAPF